MLIINQIIVGLISELPTILYPILVDHQLLLSSILTNICRPFCYSFPSYRRQILISMLRMFAINNLHIRGHHSLQTQSSPSSSLIHGGHRRLIRPLLVGDFFCFINNQLSDWSNAPNPSSRPRPLVQDAREISD